MRHPGPLVLSVLVLALLGLCLYDLARAPRPVSIARYDWGVMRPPRLPLLDPKPPRVPRRSGSASVVSEARLLPLDGPPPLGDAALPPRPLPGRAADPARLVLAQQLLGEARQARQVGPYDLVTDILDPKLLSLLDRVAAGLEAQYRARYALAPVGTAAETVVLFAREESYWEFAHAEQRLTGMRPAGHAANGLVALAVSERSADETAATLVHELTHLLNRRALGPALPPWLDEGLAEDLAKSELDGEGRLLLGTFGGSAIVGTGVVTHTGGRAALLHVSGALAAGSPPGLERLTALDWQSFVTSNANDFTYDRGFLCVRSLLDGGDASSAEAFREFLAGIAAGGSAEAEALRQRLGWSWADWNARWATFTAERAATR